MEWQDDDSLSWDARGWIQDFQEAAFEKDHEVIHELRVAVYEHTLRLVDAGCHEVLREAEFHSCFGQVVFAIRDDHNLYKWCNPEGNLVPFQCEFSGAGR